MVATQAYNAIFRQGMIAPSDPPLTRTGMTLTVINEDGRLLYFKALAHEVAKPADVATRPGEPDWNKLLDLAGLAPDTLRLTTPRVALRYRTDNQRHNWLLDSQR